MKNNKTVRTLIEKAYASNQKQAVMKREGREVYEVTIRTSGVYLYHYGTLIAKIQNGVGEIFNGAFSASDRDAINNFFDWHNLNTRARIKQGILQIA